MVQSVETKNSFFCSIINLEGNYSSLIELIQLVNLKLCNTFIFEANKRLCKAGKLFLQEKKKKNCFGPWTDRVNRYNSRDALHKK